MTHMKTTISRLRSGFTLIEIMIVVAIIGLLASAATPSILNAIKKARRQTCVLNLTQIAGAKRQWALENKRRDQDVPTESDLAPDLEKGMPSCPGGGKYTIGSVAEQPTCDSEDGHKL
jgi:prepilin-type N-terminal cleavage/methylation domain-containing protein